MFMAWNFVHSSNYELYFVSEETEARRESMECYPEAETAPQGCALVLSYR